MKAEETKKTGFNALDIIVILVIVALLVTVIVRSGLAEKLTFFGKDFTVTCRAEATDGLHLESLNNAKLYTDNEHLFGTVKNVRYLINGDGEGYIEIEITANLMKKDGRFITEEGISVVRNAQLSLSGQLVHLTYTVDKVE